MRLHTCSELKVPSSITSAVRAAARIGRASSASVYT